MTPDGAAPGLPPLLVLTDRRAAAAQGRSLRQTVEAAVAGGARAVVLREKDLPRRERARLACRLREVLAPVGGLLIVASDPTLGGDGVHLGEAEPPLAGPLVGRSCHDAAGLARAAREGCAYATVSPVLLTPSKPGYGPPLGFAGLRELTERAGSLPVYALGGLDATRAVACRAAGAAGLAVMGALMGAPEPAAEVARLLAAWHGAAQDSP